MINDVLRYYNSVIKIALYIHNDSHRGNNWDENFKVTDIHPATRKKPPNRGTIPFWFYIVPINL